MTDFEERIAAYMKEKEMVRQGDLVLCGVSGGADSMCLLQVLHALSGFLGIQLSVVHVNHGIRQEAGEDAGFVRAFCDRLSVPFRLVQADIPALAKKNHRGLEETGRCFRYQTFHRIADEIGAARIAVAHQKDDTAETILMNLFRGASLTGAAGIRPVRGRLIRPLLCVKREEIEAYLREGKIPFRTDSSNDSDAYTRNRIRHHVLSYAVDHINPGVIDHLARAGERFAEADDYLDLQAKDILSKSRIEGEAAGIQLSLYRKAPQILRRKVILQLLEQVGGRRDLTGDHLEKIDAACMKPEGSACLNLPGHLLARRSYDQLRIERVDEEKKPSFVLPASFPLPSCRPGDRNQTRFISGFAEVSLCLFPWKKKLNIPRNPYTKWFDYDKIQSNLVFRRRKQGDYLQITDDGHKKSLKAYMIDEKIPAEERDHLLVLCDGSHVVWVPGYRISAAYKLTEDTDWVLEVKLIPDLSGK